MIAHDSAMDALARLPRTDDADILGAYIAMLEAARDDWRQRAEALTAEAEALRRDAERYRWLRDGTRSNRVPHISQYPAQSFDHPRLPHFKDVGLDAAIDAARQQEAPNEG